MMDPRVNPFRSYSFFKAMNPAMLRSRGRDCRGARLCGAGWLTLYALYLWWWVPLEGVILAGAAGAILLSHQHLSCSPGFVSSRVRGRANARQLNARACWVQASVLGSRPLTPEGWRATRDVLALLPPAASVPQVGPVRGLRVFVISSGHQAVAWACPSPPRCEAWCPADF